MVGLVLVFVAVKLVDPGSASRSDRPFGPFVGYAWLGSVTSVGASFTVPRVAHGSGPGLAATWIGVQGQGPPQRFVQIGVIEARVPLAHKRAPVGGYFTFWSDAGHHFKETPLFRVHAGDDLSAHLTHAHKRWTLAIIDTTTGAKANFTIANEPEATYNEAEWTQEDPGGAAHPAPYPQLTAPDFRHLEVNSKAPSTADLFSAWMSVSDTIFAPTAMHDDSFTLKRAPTLSAGAAQYLRLIGADAATFNKFETERKGWTPKTPYKQIVAACSELIAVSRNASRSLLTARWPKQIRSLIHASTRGSNAVIELLRSPALLTPATFDKWNSELTQAVERSARPGLKLRAARGLPGLLA